MSGKKGGQPKATDPRASGTAFRKSSKRSAEDGVQRGPAAKRAQVAKPKRADASPHATGKKGAGKKAPVVAEAPVPKPKKYETLSGAEAEQRAAPSALKKEKKATQKDVGEATAMAQDTKPERLARGLRIVAGSYERFLYGLVGRLDNSHGKLAVRIEPQFVFPAHVSSIRTVACAGLDSKWLVTGGTDETIKVWDMRRRVEVGALVGHEGTITSLSFASRTFLLSTSEDGTINLYRARDWSLMRTLRGHSGRINSASAHPSGRVALSVGADRTIRMWDLMRGVGSASVKIGIEAELVRWDTLGKRFAVMAQRQAMVFATDMTKLAEVERRERLHDVSFLRAPVADGAEHELMFVATETGTAIVYDLDALEPAANEDAAPAPSELARLVGHRNRVRSVCALRAQTADGAEHVLATTISSDGYVRVFSLAYALRSGDKPELQPVSEFNTKRSRLTCLSVVGFDVAAEMGDLEEEPEGEGLEGLDEEDEEEANDDEEDSDVELERLEEQVRQAREAGLVLEGDEDEEEVGEDDEVVSTEGEDKEEPEEEPEGEPEEESEGE